MYKDSAFTEASMCRYDAPALLPLALERLTVVRRFHAVHSQDAHKVPVARYFWEQLNQNLQCYRHTLLLKITLNFQLHAEYVCTFITDRRDQLLILLADKKMSSLMHGCEVNNHSCSIIRFSSCMRTESSIDLILQLLCVA